MPAPTSSTFSLSVGSPFPLLLQRLNEIKLNEAKHTPASLIQSIGRVLSDSLLHAALLFIPHCSNELSEAGEQDYTLSSKVSLELLRFGNWITQEQSDAIEKALDTVKWIAASSSRHPHSDVATEIINHAINLIEYLGYHFDSVVESNEEDLAFDDVKREFQQKIKIATLKDQLSTKKKHGSRQTFDIAKRFWHPLYNTIPELELGSVEQEEEEKYQQQLEEFKEQKQQFEENERKKKEKLVRELKKQEEKRKEQEERRRKAEEDGEEYDELTEEKETAEIDGDEDEIVADLEPPKEVDSFTPLSFCCIICDQQLLTPESIQKIEQNQIFTKPDMELSNLYVNSAEQWMERYLPIDYIENAEPNEEESEESDDNVLSPTFSGKGKIMKSQATYCRSCGSYLGRFIPSVSSYRIVYIHSLTGKNFMYLTKKIGCDQMAPLLAESSEQDEEEEEEEAEEENDNEEVASKPLKLPKPIPQVYGLPNQYVSIAQAELYPYPRYGALTPYTEAPASRDTQVDGNKPLTKLQVLSVGEALSLLRAAPDDLYAAARSSLDHARLDCHLLLSTDTRYVERRTIDIVVTQLQYLFANFFDSVYGNASKSPIAPFAHFFLKPPQWSHARGTARYVFHFLTGKADEKCKRKTFTVSNFLATITKPKQFCVYHMTVGGEGGHRFVLVQIGQAFRILQANHALEDDNDRYSLLDWLSDDQDRWARTLTLLEATKFFQKFERIRKGEKDVWEELFCRGKTISVPSHSPQDAWKEDDIQYSQARILRFATQILE